MTKRRPLVEGLRTSHESLSDTEKNFVFGEDQSVEAKKETLENAPQMNNSVLPKMTGRVPITTRARPEIGSALKRASLQRQLDGIEPSSMQDIMEAALENWLRGKGYIE